MRVAGWRVDGYGVLAGYRVEDLPDGLSIVHGPNEAGKSTLLDFLRWVLFGFPDRRRRATHEPLRGGRHGGSVRLVDERGGAWLLERYAGSRYPVLTAPDGAAADAAELLGLLGGADAEVFRNVFAFGLGELASLETLEKDEVRDLVFSAGILGAGRSAMRAVQTLAERQAAIVRPRQQDARANRLRRELDELEEERRSLRDAAAEYPTRRREHAELAAAAAGARASAEETRARLADLDRLDQSWPVWVRRGEALDVLHTLADRDAGADALLEHESTIRRLARERSGHDERLARRTAVLAALDECERQIAAELADVGHGASLDAALHAERGIELREHVRLLAEREPEVRVLARTSAEELDRAATELATRRAERAAASAGADEPPPAPAAESAGRDLQELRGLVGERDRLLAERGTAEQAERLARLAAARSGAPGRALGAALAVLAVAVAVIAGLGARGHSPALGAALGAVALVLAVLAAVAWWAARRARAADAAPSGEGAPRYEVDLARHGERIAALAAGLGLATAPSSAEVEAALRRNDAERAERRRLDALDAEVEAAEAHASDATARLADHRRELASLQGEAASLASSLGLDGLGSAGLVQATTHFAAVRELASTRARLTGELDALSEEIGRYERESVEVAERLGDRGPAPGVGATAGTAGGDPGADPTNTEGARGAAGTVELLEHTLAVQLETEATRARLERTVADSDAELARVLGGAKGADRLREELELGDVAAWQAERARLDRELAELGTRYDEQLRAALDAERWLEELETSGRVAEVELRIAGCESELATALQEYAVLGMARTLLERTLVRYERERQPAVVARAGGLFARVTGGRYVQLVARAEGETGRSHGIVAISAAGERVDSAELSRGTAEQLYLCLRLALATSFAGGAAALPIVLDDVLVNFDPARAAAVAETVAEVAKTHQVLAFTCHPHVVELLRGVAPDARVAELPPSR